ncbi:DUF4381 domain-containing protein [Thalassotalea piscium]
MDPLAQLKDIHIPQEIHNYPVAYGWWILFTLILVFLLFFVRTIIRHRRKTKAKRIALKNLSGPIGTNDDIIVILKWAAIQYFPRQEIAQYYGEQLNRFLLKQLPEKYHQQFIKLSEEGFNSRYQLSEETLDTRLLQAAQIWVKHALPAKNKRKSGDKP